MKYRHCIEQDLADKEKNDWKVELGARSGCIGAGGGKRWRERCLKSCMGFDLSQDTLTAVYVWKAIPT